MRRIICTSCVVLNLSLAASLAQAQPVAVQQAPGELKSAQHLKAATAMLNGVPSKPAGKDADEKIGDLRRHYAAMVAAYRAEMSGAELGIPQVVTGEGEERGKHEEKISSNWREIFSVVERDLVKIVGGGSSLGPATGVVIAPVVPAAADIAASPSTVPAPIDIGGVPAGSTGTPAASTSSTSSGSATSAAVNPGAGTPSVPEGQAAPAGQVPDVSGRGGVPSSAAAAPPPPPAGTAESALAQARAAGVPVGPTTQTAAVRTEVPAVGVDAAEAGLLGFAATKLNARGITDLDLEARRQLDQFRVQLELFYTEALNEAVRKPVVRD